jgi:hypothetical protein
MNYIFKLTSTRYKLHESWCIYLYIVDIFTYFALTLIINNVSEGVVDFYGACSILCYCEVKWINIFIDFIARKIFDCSIHVRFLLINHLLAGGLEGTKKRARLCVWRIRKLLWSLTKGLFKAHFCGYRFITFRIFNPSD